MEDGLLRKQGKKLLVIALVLLATAYLVGGEEDPGMIGQMQDPDAIAKATPYAEPARFESNPPPANVQQQSNARQDPSLDAWYAAAGPNEKVEPEPIDDSHLITSTDPIEPAGPIG